MSDAFNIYVYAIEGGYEAEIRDAPNSSYTGHGDTAETAVIDVLRLVGAGDDELRRIEREPDGFWIEAQLTSEGVIVDRYAPNQMEPVATFGQTYEEMLG